jgi:hypothetical protein
MTRGPAGRRLLAEFFSQAIDLEQVLEPRPTWQVIAGLRRACGAFGISKVTIGSTGRTVCAVGMLVVPHCRMLAVVECDAVVGADVDRLNRLVVDCV